MLILLIILILIVYLFSVKVKTNICDEGALKIKEITYIHAESYSGSSLKHGPFGLLEELPNNTR